MKVLFALVLMAGVLSAGCFVNVTQYIHPDGSTVFVGDFYNDAEGPGYGPAEVSGKVYDAAGNLIGNAGGYLCPGGVYPKGMIPFKAWVGPTAAKPARVDWSVIDPPANPYLATGLTAKVTNTYTIGSQTYVVGEATNNSKNIYVAATICASWTDANGHVVRETWNNGGAWRFNPGDVLPFSINVDAPPADSTIHFYLDAGRTDVPGYVAPNTLSIPLSALQHSFQQTLPAPGGGFVTLGMGEVKNTGSGHFLADAVANVTDASGKLLATRGEPSQCIVDAPPGGITYMSYTVTANVATPPKITLQGVQYNNGTVYFPKTSDLLFKVDNATHLVTVTGTLTNTSAAVLKSANVCAAAYDHGGIVRNIGMTNLDLPPAGLAVGAKVPFTVIMSAPAGITSVKAIADGVDK
ncbi:MAG: hypothetical protein M3P30_08735 [Chloroflexota bacterium]|nr:hypothetical protein [Chloroflexota bacterium]